MPKYERPFAPEAELSEDELDTNLNNAEPPKNVEDATWKKRYGDLRSHTQKQMNEMTARLKAAEEQLKTTTTNQLQLPSTPEEVEEWSKKYPRVAAVIETIAIQKYKALNEGIEERFKIINQREQETAAESALTKLRGIHTDFDAIQNNDEFHAWLATKSKRTQDTIYENETDYEAAAETIDLFKLATNWGKKRPNQRDTNKDNARDIPNRSSNRPSNNTEPMFKESEIMAMKGLEFEKNMEAIEKAQREGRIEYDVTNAKEAARG